MRRYFLICLAVSTIAAVLSGCFSRASYREVNYYDFENPPAALPPGMAVNVIPFRISDSGKYKMAYSEENCQVLIDEYNKWVQPPEFMVTRYLQIVFSRAGGDGNQQVAGTRFTIDGSIFLFRIDLPQKKALFGVNYKIMKRGDGGDETSVFEDGAVFTADFKEASPDCFAVAMSHAVDKFARELRMQLIELQNKKPVVPVSAAGKVPEPAPAMSVK